MSSVRTIFSGMVLAALAFAVSAVLSLVFSIPYRIGEAVEPPRPGTILTEQQLSPRIRAGQTNLAAAKTIPLGEIFWNGAAFYFAFVAPAFVAACTFFRARRPMKQVLFLIAPALILMLILGAEIYGVGLLAIAAATLMILRGRPSKGFI